MKRNRFTDTLKKIKKEDIVRLEELLSRKLPESFVAHYLKYNGGVPDLDWVPGKDDFEPTVVQEFYSIYTSEISDDLKSDCLYEHYMKMIEMNVIESNLLPFAVDPGGNFYSLNLNDGSIFYCVTEGVKRARLIFDDFSSFLSSLTDEDDAFK